MPMSIDCVFSGGGVRAYAFIGAYDILEQQGYQVNRVAGSSAGAIFASLIAAGYSSQEIHELMLDLYMKKLLAPPGFSSLPLFKWILFYFHKGLYKGNRLEKWIQEALDKKNIYTFKEININHLKVVVSDIYLGKLVVIHNVLKSIYNIDHNKFFV